MKYEDNPRSIKFYVKRFFLERAGQFKGKLVVDFPAGTGVTSRILKEIGAIPKPFDLFPEHFEVDGLTCAQANIKMGIPMKDGVANAVVCQEGIEHFQDQLQALKEFNRILKPEGMLLLTTPNYSNLRAKVSYLLSESERFGSLMAPNEIDSIWFTDNHGERDIYYGHIFLIGIQKLRILARLAGFRIRRIHFTRYKSTSVFLFPILYPLILLSNWLTYRRNLRKASVRNHSIAKEIYREVYRLGIAPKLLVCSHLMIEFEKDCEIEEVVKRF